MCVSRVGGCASRGWCPPPRRQTDACVKILPHPKLRLQAAKMMATESGHIDFMFLGPPTRLMDPLLITKTTLYHAQNSL